ncbi:MAG TPA: hypothetical protein VNX86_10530 [Rhizomicrobium sp.]|nr:hypothetical protein [Rhizomicrobium sp.]
MSGVKSLASGAALLLCLAPPAFASTYPHSPEAPVAPGVSTGACTESTASYSVSTDLQSTFKKSFVTVSGTTLNFSQGATGCVEVSFSGEVATAPGEILLTRVVLDGSTVCLPSDNLFGSEGTTDNPADHAMNYICPNVSSGAHNVKVQFASRFGAKVSLDYRTTIVRYAP